MVYLIDYRPSQYHYLFRVYFSMCAFHASFRNKLYIFRSRNRVQATPGLVRFSWALISPSFLGRSPFLLASGLYSCTNLWMRVSFILNKRWSTRICNPQLFNLNYLGFTLFHLFYGKGKASLEWPRGFQEFKVPTFHDNGTGWWQGCQPYAPTAFTPRKCSLYPFLLETESTPGP